MHIPQPPRDFEKYLYIYHRQKILTFFSFFGFMGVLISSFLFFSTDKILYLFYPFLLFSFITYIVSVYVQGFGKAFDPYTHDKIVKNWLPKRYPSVRSEERR